MQENLSGLPILEKIKRKSKWYLDTFKEQVKARWNLFSDERKEAVVSILNYGANAIPISFFVISLSTLLLELTFWRVIIIFICVWIFLIYFEYYYRWMQSAESKNR